MAIVLQGMGPPFFAVAPNNTSRSPTTAAPPGFSVKIVNGTTVVIPPGAAVTADTPVVSGDETIGEPLTAVALLMPEAQLDVNNVLIGPPVVIGEGAPEILPPRIEVTGGLGPIIG